MSFEYVVEPYRWAEAWGGAVVKNGGTVSTTRMPQVRTLLAASMACGHFWATDDLALLTAENEGQALTTLKRRALMTAVNAPTFTIDRGYAFNGTTQYIDTGFVASTMARSMTPGNIRVGVYERTNVAANANAFGAAVSSGTPNTIVARPRSLTNVLQVQMMSTPDTTSLSGITDSRGLTVQSRAGGATSVKSFKNSVSLADVTGLTVNNTQLPDGAFNIGAGRSAAGAANTFRASTIGAAEWGAPLTASQEGAWYIALQAFETAIGASV